MQKSHPLQDKKSKCVIFLQICSPVFPILEGIATIGNENYHFREKKKKEKEKSLLYSCEVRVSGWSLTSAETSGSLPSCSYPLNSGSLPTICTTYEAYLITTFP